MKLAEFIIPGLVVLAVAIIFVARRKSSPPFDVGAFIPLTTGRVATASSSCWPRPMAFVTSAFTDRGSPPGLRRLTLPAYLLANSEILTDSESDTYRYTRMGFSDGTPC